MLNANIPLISCVFVLVLGSFVFLKNTRALLNILFGLFALAISVWLFGTSMMFGARTDAQAIFWDRFIYMGVVFIPVLVHHFSLAYAKKKSQKIILILGYVFAFVFLFSSQTDYFVKGLFKYQWGSHTVAQPLHHVFLILFWIQVAISIRNLYQYYRNPDNDNEKNRTKYVFVAFLILFLVGAFAYLPAYRIPVYPFPFLSGVIFVTVLAYAIVRYRLLEIRIAVTRAGIFLTVYSLVLGLPFWFAFATGLWAWAMGLMGILASSGPFLFILLRKKAESIILAEQKRYQRILLQASSGMIKQHDLERLLKLIVYIIKRAVKIKYCAVFFENKASAVYELRAIRDGKRKYPAFTFVNDSPLVNYIRKHKEPFYYDELPPSIKTSVAFDLPITLIVPSYMDNTLLGFLFLGPKLNGKPYSEDDIRVFKTLSNQAAMATVNCIFVKEFKKTQERLFSAEKLALIGGMADGLAHQIKNRLNEFSLGSVEMLMEIGDIEGNYDAVIADKEALKKKIDYLKECANAMQKNVKKTSSVIQGILNFAKTGRSETGFDRFSITPLITQCVDLLKVKHQISEFPLALELNENDTVYGVQAQILECLLNTLDNAYEATKEKCDFRLPPEEKECYKPLITLRLTHSPTHDLIAVKDNGIGIKDEDKLKVFSAFFTTKPSSKSGSGIGAYVVRRMIEENHGGRIWFESVYRSGTTFFIELPRQ